MSVKYTATRFSWLESYLANEEEIASLELNKKRTEIELRRWTDGDLAHVRIQKGSHGAKVEEALAEINAALAEDKELQAITLDLIERFDGLENTILRRKYVDGMSLMDIANCDDIGYSYSTIKRVHAELKHTLKFLDKWDVPGPGDVTDVVSKKSDRDGADTLIKP
ncbi:hypothetical protein [Lacticaseibacillus sp. N501-2]|uniref:hypothetical protein n=1 Tax=Lacticaseibacillus salsurae TaxID=3367729 RepID=UPI0038B327CA